MNLEQFKSSFPKTTRWIHLNNAGMALMTSAAKNTATHWIDRLQIEGAHCAPELLQQVEKARASLASLIGCKPSELGFFQSTSGAVSQIAFGIGLETGDEIITWDQEYPSNSLPWKVAAERTGARLVTVKSDEDFSTPVEKLLAAITERTRVIAISWVQYQTGSITDLKKLSDAARARNIWTVVDVIQGVGQLPFDFQASGIDVVCGGSHKWLMSLIGVGFVAVREERIEEILPLMIGTETYQVSSSPADMYKVVKKEAAKFESGSKQLIDLAALGASAEILHLVGVEKIASEIQSRARYLRRGLLNVGATLHSDGSETARGSIVNFSLGGMAERARIEKLFIQERIGYSRRGPGIRLSPHVYTSEADMDRVVSLLKENL